MAELTKLQLQALQFNTEVATASAVSDFVNASTTELSSSLIARIQALEGFSTFIGVKDALPESAENGQIVIVGEKEYIWGPKADGVAGWTELGDTTAEAAAIDELSNAVAYLDATKADVSSVNASVEALTSAIADVEASLSGYDTIGSADAALTSAKAYTDEQVSALSNDVHERINEEVRVINQEISSVSAYLDATKADVSSVNASVEALTSAIADVEASLSGYDTIGSAAAAEEAAISAAKAYTDEQIAVVEGEISSLTDVVETKADQAAVDAAISAINENISTLSAKAEEDPVFTAWKDGESVSLGNNADASNDNGPAIAIGTNASASDNGTAIGWDSVASGIDAIAIGEGAQSESGVAIGRDAVSYSTNSIRIGTDAGLIEGPTDTTLGAMVQFGSQKITPRADGLNEDVIFKVFGYTVLNDYGQIETSNLAGMSNLQDALNNVDEVTASDDIAKLRATVNALAAAIKAFAGL